MLERQSIAGIARKGSMYLIAKRKPGGALSEKWEFPGGKVEQGETHQQAMVREWAEELNITVEPGSFICSGSFIHKGLEFQLSAYEVTLKSEEFVMLEHTEIRWEPMGVLETMDIAESDLTLLPLIKKYYSKI